MSSPIFADVPSAFSGIVPVNFTVDNITAAKVVQEPLLAAVESATTPLYYGGCTIIDLTASSTDGASKNVIIYTGRKNRLPRIPKISFLRKDRSPGGPSVPHSSLPIFPQNILLVCQVPALH